jgi:hypothetical protein
MLRFIPTTVFATLGQVETIIDALLLSLSSCCCL